MGWFGGNPTRVSAVTEITEDAEARPKLLEDLSPKFQDKAPEHDGHPSILDAVKNLKLSDFTLERYLLMPCFREAMLTGFQAMAVFGVVTLLVHKDPNRSAKWSLGGFFLGNFLGWEQCRSLRRRSMANIEAAKRVNQQAVLKRMNEQLKEK